MFGTTMKTAVRGGGKAANYSAKSVIPETGLLSGMTPKSREATLDRFLEFLGRAEGHLLAGLDVDRLAGRGVAPHAGCTLADLEDAEPHDADPLALLQVLGDPGDDVVQNRFGLLLGQFLVLGDGRRQVLERNGRRCRCFLRHLWPSLVSLVRMA